MFVSITRVEFRRRAERLFGGKVSVIDGEKRFTYAEFGERSRRLATVIQGWGSKPASSSRSSPTTPTICSRRTMGSCRPGPYSTRSTSGCTRATSRTVALQQ
jgi:hypothetical protein